MRRFYTVYSHDQIGETVFTQFETLPAVSTGRKFFLSWSHYLKLMRISNVDERHFYEIESAKNDWSLSELKRQYDSSLYERLALSTDKDKIYRLALEGQTIETPQDAVKDPYVLEFLGLPELPEYLASIRSLREKYAGKIQILLGLECEYFPEYLDWLRGVRSELDYLILGNHFALTDEPGATAFSIASTPEAVEEYTEDTLAGMRTGLFSYLAHPELVLAQYPAFDAVTERCAVRLCREAKQLDLPLECNLYGMIKRENGVFSGLGYPCREFWQIAAAEGCRAVIGFDAHRPQQLAELTHYSAARSMLEELGILIVEELSLV